TPTSSATDGGAGRRGVSSGRVSFADQRTPERGRSPVREDAGAYRQGDSRAYSPGPVYRQGDSRTDDYSPAWRPEDYGSTVYRSAPSYHPRGARGVRNWQGPQASQSSGQLLSKQGYGR